MNAGSGLILDPADPSRAIIRYATESELGLPVDDVVIENIHPATACAGRSCVIHAPTDHLMSPWRLVWRDEKGMFERLCSHAVGHPDPDQFDYWREVGLEHRRSHGCDGCCED